MKGSSEGWSAILVIVLLLSCGLCLPVSYSISAEICLIPKVSGFDTVTTPVGHRWNLTIWVRDISDLYAYQVMMIYNSTIVNVTRAWLPKWDE